MGSRSVLASLRDTISANSGRWCGTATRVPGLEFVQRYRIFKPFAPFGHHGFLRFLGRFRLFEYFRHYDRFRRRVQTVLSIAEQEFGRFSAQLKTRTSSAPQRAAALARRAEQLLLTKASSARKAASPAKNWLASRIRRVRSPR